ncbi:fibronectin type III domain-containing protein [bacterium]|jgi:hypothetical protein|nr:fibronectin type III domain-containing protein [bacterium]MBT3581798.1 fibronectin type III domain-containing protein [bacterium]MBT4552488.1 fibronectin type III domain-containing protein [bacterium]MBT7088135.1 fibronectin type III domain-containing protein [bacterium]
MTKKSLSIILILILLTLGLATLATTSGCGATSSTTSTEDSSSEESEDSSSTENATELPSMPTGLAATAGNLSVSLSWTEVEDATSYNIYWGTSDSITTDNATKIDDITDTSYSHTGLTNGTTYYYILTAINSVGESDATSAVSATPALSWTTSTLISTGAAGQFSTIAIDSNDKIHIAYYANYGSGDIGLRYYTNQSGSWVEETVDTDGISESISIAVDSDSGIHISYYSTNGYNLKYAYKADDSWTKATVDSTGTMGQYNAMAVDSSNSKIHIVYGDVTLGSLKYATNTIGETDTWNRTIIDSSATGQVHASIALDSNGTAHIAYRQATSTLKYVTGSLNSWSTPVTIDSGGVISDTSIALDSNNKVHISYYKGGETKISYATNTSGSWVADELTDSYCGSSGKHTSIALDSSDNIYISYYKESSTYSALKIIMNIDDTWDDATIDEDSDEDGTGKYTSIAIDSTDKIHIAYYQSNGSNLKYAVSD